MIEQHPTPADRDSGRGESGHVEAFLSRYGDLIDDRIAESLDELIDERLPRPTATRAVTVLVVAVVVVSVLLRHSAAAVAAVWGAAAVICLALTRLSAGVPR